MNASEARLVGTSSVMHMYRFQDFAGTNPTQADWRRIIQKYAELEITYGDDPNAISKELGVSPGTACRLRSLVRELSGLKPPVYDAVSTFHT